MSSSKTQSVHQNCSWQVFDQIRALLQQWAEAGEGWMLTEAQFTAKPAGLESFAVLVSPGFNALLMGKSIESESENCQLEITFSPSAIAAFLDELQSRHPAMIQSNDPDLQSEFTLDLIRLLSEKKSNHPDSAEQALLQQVEQERLLNEVTKLIRQSLELPVILETAVEQVRQFLGVDRLIIYQFNIPAPSCLIDSQRDDARVQQAIPCLDAITYESRSSEEIPAILHFVEECNVIDMHQLKQLHGSATWAIADCEIQPSAITTLLKLPEEATVRAELGTPIVVQNELWGLLIAHQCFEPRQWQDREKLLLRRIGGHLAIAIYQAKLYAELQQQKKSLEQQIIDRTQELRDTLISAQSADRAKTEFLATMSHELRTPLTTIIGMSATLLRYYKQQSIASMLTLEKQIDYLQTIQNRGEHLLALINDILDLSQVEAGKTILQVREFSLAQVAHQTIKLLQEKADAKQVQLCLQLLTSEKAPRSQVDPNAPGFKFSGDPKRIQQILINLMSNAIKFTPSEGRVTLRVRVHGDTAILQVEDTGIGIAPEQRSLLFQKFQQLDASYHRKYEGTGLGLALTKQLVELHGGTIEVESTVGVGSTFTVFLPAQALSAIDRARAQQQAVPTLRPRIVLVEEHEEVASFICDLLTAADYQVIWIMDSSAAVRQIEVLQPTIAIVDLQLPARSGYQIIQQLRSTLADLNTKILALTPQLPAGDAEPEVDDYLVTPLLNNTATLLAQSEQIIDKVGALLAQ